MHSGEWDDALGGPRVDAASLAAERIDRRPEGFVPAYTHSKPLHGPRWWRRLVVHRQREDR